MHHVVAAGQPAREYLPGYLGLCGDIWGNSHSPQVPIISSIGCFLFAAQISTACKTVLELSSLLLGNFSSYAGAFKLFSLVSATQRRRHLVADARRQKYEPGFSGSPNPYWYKIEGYFVINSSYDYMPVALA